MVGHVMQQLFHGLLLPAVASPATLPYCTDCCCQRLQTSGLKLVHGWVLLDYGRSSYLRGTCVGSQGHFKIQLYAECGS